MQIEDFDYFLPERNIAYKPHSPRDLCKLLVIDTRKQTMDIDTFLHLSHYIPKSSIIVFNNTKVAKARIDLQKENGKNVTALIFTDDLLQKNQKIRCLVNKKIIVGTNLYMRDICCATVVDQHNEIFYLSPTDGIDMLSVIERYGTMPIPPYLKKTTLTKKELIKKYQPIFADKIGSYAAPTASLHFTDRVLESLSKKNITQAFLTLHVGYGTFSQVTSEQINTKKLHSEFYEIPTITQRILRNKNHIIATGTTVVRTLETYMATHKSAGNSELFIQPGFNFNCVDSLITNFHVPKSSLMMLVQAFLEHKKSNFSIKEVYSFALKHDFKFLSFGDAMLII